MNECHCDRAVPEYSNTPGRGPDRSSLAVPHWSLERWMLGRCRPVGAPPRHPRPRMTHGSDGVSSRCTRSPTPGLRCCSWRPLLVSLALKVNDLVGIDRRPEQPGAGHRRRLAVGDRGQPVLRQAQRSHVLASGMRRPWMVVGVAGGCGRPDRRARLQHRGRPARLVRRPGVLQRAARRPGRRAARPGPASPARPRLRDPRPCASRSRRWPGPSWSALRPATELTMFLAPCAVGGVLVPALRRHAGRPPAGPGRTSRRGRCGSSSPRSTSTRGPAPTSRGPSPAGSCS